MPDIGSFLFAAIGTLGYAVTYNIPKKLLPLAAITGGIGWTVFCCFPSHPIYGCFFAALSVGILGEIFARKFKDAATLFILPGIFLFFLFLFIHGLQRLINLFLYLIL